MDEGLSRAPAEDLKCIIGRMKTSFGASNAI